LVTLSFQYKISPCRENVGRGGGAAIDPIAAIPAIGTALSERKVPLVAVSLIIGSSAVKGPAAKMMAEMGLPVSALGIARYYGTCLHEPLF
jgi:2-phospho-L-lactate transferase/gluconeogenesis factor (CofD/UPF0052 family)